MAEPGPVLFSRPFPIVGAMDDRWMVRFYRTATAALVVVATIGMVAVVSMARHEVTSSEAGLVTMSTTQESGARSLSAFPRGRRRALAQPLATVHETENRGDEEAMPPPAADITLRKLARRSVGEGPHRHVEERGDDRKESSDEVQEEKKSETSWEAFEGWMEKHKRNYGSHAEKKRRFKIWVGNHLRTVEKNMKHGRCKLSNQHIFGDNHFKDLTQEEFKAQFMAGYNGPHTNELQGEHRNIERTDEVLRRRRAKTTPLGQQSRKTAEAPLDPLSDVDRHPEVQRAYEKHFQSSPRLSEVLVDETYVGHFESSSRFYGETTSSHHQVSSPARQTFTIFSCRWYDVSCLLRVIFTGSPFGGSSEPVYNENNYPSAFDWREVGAITSIHSQGNCGACWAITAVETAESAYFLKYGELIDLAESEVIVCDYTCEMCSGGWPQNAYEYMNKYNGLPPEAYWYYNGDWLLMLSYFAAGQSDQLNADDVYSYLAQQCPNGGWIAGEGGSGSHSGSGSNDNNGEEDDYDNSYLSAPRYGKVKDYAYATDRCICYTDGTGCECDDQDEKRALMNIASYGPATVCLDASVWQDYAGGIMTSESGCSAEFLDMNHCVQAVGYAFIDASEEEGNEEWDEEQNSQSGSQKSGSQDDGNRQGYWIIRNQWSSNWGMNGYIYLAMGENTCGVLNDMTQAFAS